MVKNRKTRDNKSNDQEKIKKTKEIIKERDIKQKEDTKKLQIVKRIETNDNNNGFYTDNDFVYYDDEAVYEIKEEYKKLSRMITLIQEEKRNFIKRIDEKSLDKFKGFTNKENRECFAHIVDQIDMKNQFDILRKSLFEIDNYGNINQIKDDEIFFDVYQEFLRKMEDKLIEIYRKQECSIDYDISIIPMILTFFYIMDKNVFRSHRNVKKNTLRQYNTFILNMTYKFQIYKEDLVYYYNHIIDLLYNLKGKIHLYGKVSTSILFGTLLHLSDELIYNYPQYYHRVYKNYVDIYKHYKDLINDLAEFRYYFRFISYGNPLFLLHDRSNDPLFSGYGRIFFNSVEFIEKLFNREILSMTKVKEKEEFDMDMRILREGTNGFKDFKE